MPEPDTEPSRKPDSVTVRPGAERDLRKAVNDRSMKKRPAPVASSTAAASDATTGKKRSMTARVTEIGRGTRHERSAAESCVGEVVATTCTPTPSATAKRIR